MLHKKNIDGAYKCVCFHLKTAYNELVRGGGVEGIKITILKINPVWNVSFRILVFFKEIITLALAKRNRGIGAFAGWGQRGCVRKRLWWWWGVSMGNIIVKNGFIKKGSLNDFDIYSSLIRMISVIWDIFGFLRWFLINLVTVQPSCDMEAICLYSLLFLACTQLAWTVTKLNNNHRRNEDIPQTTESFLIKVQLLSKSSNEPFFS